jgi:hypothetical protein
MCRRIDCAVCGKPTFAGCGLHVESVLRDVPPAERCPGHRPEDKGPAAAAERPVGAPPDERGRKGS